MSSTGDFHSKPFDEGTKVKLRLFEDYIREWLPVFLTQASGHERINIVDFFAGPGKDVNGIPGSPLVALKEIRKFTSQIRSKGTPVHLLLNEKAPRKAATLSRTLRDQNVPADLCKWGVDKLEFDEAFERHYDALRGSANLLFLDQGGVKFISDEIFSRILSLSRTDFMFFIASSSLRRFGDHPHFRRHLRIPRGTISARGFNDTHRAVTKYYRASVPKEKEFYLGSFSIKKGSNLYGIIFGSAHPLGIEKFLRVCWREDPTRGEANFDIDEEKIDRRRPHLFPEMDRPKKLHVFQQELQKRLLKKEFATDGEVYLFTLQEGFLPAHGREVLATMREEARIGMEKPRVRPRVSLEGYKNPRRLKISVDGKV